MSRCKGSATKIPAFFILVTAALLSGAAGALQPVYASSDSVSTIILTPLESRLGEEQLREPLGLAVDNDGFVYTTDAMTGKVFRFAQDGSYIEFENPALDAAFYPIDLSLNGPFVYILDYSGNRILRYDRQGAYMDILISFGNIEGMRPVSLTGGNGGRFLTTDFENHGMAVWNSFLDLELNWNDFGWGEGSLDRPAKAAMLPDERIVVSELGNRRVQLFSPSGAYESLLQVPEHPGYKSPRSVSTDQEGYIFVADTDGGTVYIFDPKAKYIQKIDSYLSNKIAPSAVAAGWDDHLYIADIRSHSILVFKMVYPGK